MVGLNKRVVALLEVCSVTIVSTLMVWLLEAYPIIGVYSRWIAKASLVLIVLAASTPRGRGFAWCGLIPRNPKFTLKWSTVFVTVFIAPTIFAIYVSKQFVARGSNGLTAGSLALITIWHVFSTGFAEEALFRGYFQTRLEEVFGKKWSKLIFKSWRVRFGYGLLIASAIFGAVHMVAYWNPFSSKLVLTPTIPVHILGAFGLGCVLGALKEASSDIYVPTALHAGLNIASELLLIYADVISLNIVFFTGFFIFFYILDKYFEEAEKNK